MLLLTAGCFSTSKIKKKKSCWLLVVMATLQETAVMPHTGWRATHEQQWRRLCFWSLLLTRCIWKGADTGECGKLYIERKRWEHYVICIVPCYKLLYMLLKFTTSFCLICYVFKINNMYNLCCLTSFLNLFVFVWPTERMNATISFGNQCSAVAYITF